MPSEIERFSLYDMTEPDPEGDWVRYTDHLAVLSRTVEAEPEPVASCVSCHGTGDQGGNPSYGDCADCDGTGQTPPDQSQEIERQRARVAELERLIRWAHDTLYEINPSNYDHDEVCKLNAASVEVILGLAPELGEKHGKSDDWWSARAESRLASQERAPVQVKPLEWDRGVIDCARPLPGMKYMACSTTTFGSWAWWLEGDPETRAVFSSEADAKAAAQADYEARILSAIETGERAPVVAEASPHVEVTDAGLIQFAQWFRKNYPGPDTIIHKPDWHAPKIYRAALHAALASSRGEGE